MYKHILLAFDHTKSSEKALEAAVGLLALEKEAELTITHVSTEKNSMNTNIYDRTRSAAPIMTPGLDKQNPPYMPPLPQEDKTVAHHLNDELDEALSSVKHNLDSRGIQANFYPLSGSPAEAICEYATGNNVDLVIVGRTEKNNFQKWFLGSVSEKIMQESPCNVLVVK
ncbi:universal stress protein [Jeotgalibacillus proteolyticus]|nr:universal stress protein [Jeotgalibacillus proteolyticus]